jgi:CubicO group peptidase (beta-lactamase class C family)
MRLVEAGTLDLDSDVSRWLGWSLRNPAFPDAPVTLRQLLSHTSGIVDGPGYNFPLGATLRDNLDATRWSASPPGGRFAYANLNYGIIATVMEAATGERFDRLMTRLVLQPLNLDAGYNWSGASDAAIASAATLYRTGKDETDWHPDGAWVAQVDDMKGVRPACPVRTPAGCDLDAYRPGTNGTLFSPQGGLRISALGLAKIGRMLLGEGAVDGVRLLSPASVKTLMTPVWQASGRPQDDDYQGMMRCYGPGLHCLTGGHDAPVPGARWWGHLGEAYGLLAGLWVDRDGGRVLVYALTGTRDDPFKPAHVSAFSAVEEKILQELARTPPRR